MIDNDRVHYVDENNNLILYDKWESVTMSDNDSCAARIDSNLADRLADLHKLWDNYLAGIEDDPDLGNLWEYGLCFDYVVPDDDDDEEDYSGGERPYFRYQLSWGGPSDEFRIYASGHDYSWHVDCIEYWFLDWFDGTRRRLSGNDFRLIRDIFDDLAECGVVQAQFDKAMDL